MLYIFTFSFVLECSHWWYVQQTEFRFETVDMCASNLTFFSRDSPTVSVTVETFLMMSQKKCQKKKKNTDVRDLVYIEGKYNF